MLIDTIFRLVVVVSISYYCLQVVDGELSVENLCDSVYLDCQEADIARSREVIERIPVSNYFDIFSGEYRFGILGDDVKELFPELTLRVEKRYAMKDKSFKSVPVTALDTNYVFMHVLVGLREAISHSEDIDVALSQIEVKFAEYTRMLQGVMTYLSDKNLLNAPDIREKYSMSTMEIASLQDEIMHIEDIQSATKKVMENRRSTRMALKDKQDKEIRRLWALHQEKQLNISIDKHRKVHSILMDEMESLYEFESRQLEAAFEDEIKKLRAEIDSVIHTAKVRIEEESELERRNEDVHMNIMHAREESRRKASHEMIQVFFQEFGKYVNILMDNPRSVVLWSANILLVLAALITIIEFLKESKTIIMKSLSPPFGIDFVSSRRPNATTGIESHALAGDDQLLNSLVLPNNIQASLRSIAAVLSAQHASIRVFGTSRVSATTKFLTSFGGLIGLGPRRSSLLPNVVITGPSGSGKTVAAKALAEACGLPYATLCGADLEAHGSRASAYLRNVLDSLSSGRGGSSPCLLVIDDPESVIQTRGSGDQSLHHNKSNISYCLYVLMNAIRENSRQFGLIITTSERVFNIDDALVDRLDSIIELSHLDGLLRLRLVVQLIRELLEMYLDVENKELCQRAGQTDFDLNSMLVLEEDNDKSCPSGIETEITENGEVKQTGSVRNRRKSTPKKRGGGAAAEAAKITSDDEAAASRNKKVAQVDYVSSQLTFSFWECANMLVRLSAGWSCREIRKVVQNIQSTVLGTEKCIVTTSIWKQEVTFWIDQRSKTDQVY